VVSASPPDLLGAVETFRLPADGPAKHVEPRLGAVVIALTCRGYVTDPDGDWIALVSKLTPEPGQPAAG
jgi:hypothetical protein